jgi:hypothetical protein
MALQVWGSFSTGHKAGNAVGHVFPGGFIIDNVLLENGLLGLAQV